MSGIGFVGSGGGGGGASILAQSAVAVPLTGTLVETVLASVVLPAGAMGKNGQVVIEAIVSQTNNANVKTAKFKFGAAMVPLLISVSASATAAYGFRKRIANRNAVNVQVSGNQGQPDDFQPLNPPTIGAEDTSQPVTISITGTLTNVADTLTLESYQIRLYPKG